MSRRGPPTLPPEEPAIPLDAPTARARSLYIKEMIAKVEQLKESGKTADEIQEALPEFHAKYPMFLKVLLKDSTYKQSGSLRTMLGALDRMGTGSMTQHQASVAVGQQLHDVYIKPRLGEEQ